MRPWADRQQKNLNAILRVYESWAMKLFPDMLPADTLAKVETLGGKKAVKVLAPWHVTAGLRTEPTDDAPPPSSPRIWYIATE